MKKLIAFASIFLLSISSVFAAGSKPAGDTYQTCMNKPFEQCAAFGNPWVPNWPALKCPAGAMSASQCVANDPQPKSFIPYDGAKWQACAQPIIHDCNVRFGVKGA